VKPECKGKTGALEININNVVPGFFLGLKQRAVEKNVMLALTKWYTEDKPSLRHAEKSPNETLSGMYLNCDKYGDGYKHHYP